MQNLTLRFYSDPETNQPHIYRHGVFEFEVEAVLLKPGEDRASRDGTRIATGRTSAGRYLRVIYVSDFEPGSLFVITAYDLGRKARLAYERRRRRRRRS